MEKFELNNQKYLKCNMNKLFDEKYVFDSYFRLCQVKVEKSRRVRTGTLEPQAETTEKSTNPTFILMAKKNRGSVLGNKELFLE